jgi:hypothetical protein
MPSNAEPARRKSALRSALGSAIRPGSHSTHHDDTRASSRRVDDKVETVETPGERCVHRLHRLRSPASNVGSAFAATRGPVTARADGRFQIACRRWNRARDASPEIGSRRFDSVEVLRVVGRDVTGQSFGERGVNGELFSRIERRRSFTVPTVLSIPGLWIATCERSSSASSRRTTPKRRSSITSPARSAWHSSKQ